MTTELNLIYMDEPRAVLVAVPAPTTESGSLYIKLYGFRV